MLTIGRAWVCCALATCVAGATFYQWARTSLCLSQAAADVALFADIGNTCGKLSDARGLVARLVYVRDYYPSGTKQAKGTTLDSMVERSRELALARILERLRTVTGTNCGDDVDAWVGSIGVAQYPGSQPLP